MQRRTSSVIFPAVAVLVVAGVGFLAWLWRPNRSTVPVIDPELIATVGSYRIRVPEFTREMLRRGGGRPDAVDKTALLDEMIERRSLMEQACALGLDRSAEVIRGQENLLIGALRGSRLEPRLAAVDVSDDEAREHYQQNLDRFTVEARRRLAVIVVVIPAKADHEKRSACTDRMRQAHRRALAAAPEDPAAGFGPLAVEFSEDQTTRYKGGDIGWVSRGQVRHNCPADVVEAGFALTKIGDVSDVIETEAGLFLLRLTDERVRSATPYREVAAAIRHTLLLRKKKEIEAAFLAECRVAVPVTVSHDVLRAVVQPAAAEDAGDDAAAPPILP